MNKMQLQKWSYQKNIKHIDILNVYCGMRLVGYLTPHSCIIRNLRDKNDYELLYSYKTVVVKKSKSGRVSVSAFWSSTYGSTTTKQHISKYLQMSIKDVRKKIASGEFDTF